MVNCFEKKRRTIDIPHRKAIAPFGAVTNLHLVGTLLVAP